MSSTAAQSHLLVLTTVPERAIAEALARELLAARLAACIHIGATVRSLYHWQGQIETADETPVAIKTSAGLYSRVETAIRARHPYELPEIVAVPITHGLPEYLDWIAGETLAP
ncbi:MAG: divalent-cation tolerance protein CutA [Betaproteobacteria bacterium]|nr:MAG: divalent-cation tolerance protein CutA [Betaproteobacteria bacterium]